MKEFVKNAVVLSVLASFFVFAGSARCEDEIKTTELKETVVSVSRVEEAKKEITSNLTIIDQDIIKISPARNLGDLLAEQGIGHIQKYPGNSTSVGIRGFRTDTHGNDLLGHVLVLLNGRRAGTGNIAKISTDNIERIEIIRGPAAVQYGSAAMGGIINVITRQGKDKPGAFIEGGLGSFGYEEAGFGASGKAFIFDFSGSYSSSIMNDYQTVNDGTYYNTGYDHKHTASMNLGLEFLPENRIGVIVNEFVMDDVGSPGYLSLNDLDDYAETSNRSIDFIYNGGVPDTPVSWMTRYFEGTDKNRWWDPVDSNPDWWDDGIPYEINAQHNGAQVQLALDWDMLNIITGCDWINYETQSNYTPVKSEYDNLAGFILAKARLFDERLFITGGLRHDTYKLEVKKGEGTDERDDNLSRNLGIAFLIIDNLKIRASYGEAFIMPSAQQIACDYTAWGTHYIGNPDLDPETSRTYEAGFDISVKGFESDFTYFYTDYKNKIEPYSTGFFAKTWANISNAVIQGFDGKMSIDIGEIFDLDYQIKPYFNYVYLVEFEDESTRKDLNYTHKKQCSYGIIVSDLKTLTANLNFSYTGKQKIYDWENYAWPMSGPDRIEVGGFTVANLSISKELFDFNKAGGITLKGEITNLLKKDYEYVKGYPMPDRGYYLSLKYEF